MPKSIFILEDEYSMIQKYEAHFKGKYKVESSSDPEEAINTLIEKKEIQVAIIDLDLSGEKKILPGKSGLEVMENVYNKRNDIRFIIVSSMPMHAALKQAKERKGLMDLMKPKLIQKLDSLSEIINNALSSEQSLSEDNLKAIQENIISIKSNVNDLLEDNSSEDASQQAANKVIEELEKYKTIHAVVDAIEKHAFGVDEEKAFERIDQIIKMAIDQVENMDQAQKALVLGIGLPKAHFETIIGIAEGVGFKIRENAATLSAISLFRYISRINNSVSEPSLTPCKFKEIINEFFKIDNPDREISFFTRKLSSKSLEPLPSSFGIKVSLNKQFLILKLFVKKLLEFEDDKQARVYAYEYNQLEKGVDIDFISEFNISRKDLPTEKPDLSPEEVEDDDAEFYESLTSSGANPWQLENDFKYNSAESVQIVQKDISGYGKLRKAINDISAKIKPHINCSAATLFECHKDNGGYAVPLLKLDLVFFRKKA